MFIYIFIYLYIICEPCGYRRHVCFLEFIYFLRIRAGGRDALNIFSSGAELIQLRHSEEVSLQSNSVCLKE